MSDPLNENVISRPFDRKLSLRLDQTHYSIDELQRLKPSPGRDAKLVRLRERLAYLEAQLCIE